MDRYLLKRVIVGSRHIFATITRRFARNTAKMQYRRLRYYEFQDTHHSGGNIDRYTIFFRLTGRINSNQLLLASHCMSTRGATIFLISSHISHRDNFASLAIASSRLALTATSESRNVSDLMTDLCELICQLAPSRT